MARMERIIKRMWILAIVLIVLLCGSNAAWIWYEAQFTDEVITQDVLQEVSGEGRNYFAGGDFNGGTAESTDNNQEANP